MRIRSGFFPGGQGEGRISALGHGPDRVSHPLQTQPRVHGNDHFVLYDHKPRAGRCRFGALGHGLSFGFPPPGRGTRGRFLGNPGETER